MLCDKFILTLFKLLSTQAGLFDVSVQHAATERVSDPAVSAEIVFWVGWCKTVMGHVFPEGGIEKQMRKYKLCLPVILEVTQWQVKISKTKQKISSLS